MLRRDEVLLVSHWVDRITGSFDKLVNDFRSDFPRIVSGQDARSSSPAPLLGLSLLSSPLMLSGYTLMISTYRLKRAIHIVEGDGFHMELFIILMNSMYATLGTLLRSSC